MSSIAVVPTYNEKENIKELIDRILQLNPEIHILVVDDNSPDGTGEIVDEISLFSSRVHLIKRSDRRGRGLAGIAGFKYAIERDFDYIVEMDADLSHPPECIPILLEEIRHHDVVIGSREIKGGRAERRVLRKALTKLANFYIRLILGVNIRDCTSGFRAFKRETLASIDLDGMFSAGPSIVEEILYACHRCNYNIKEIPIVFVSRKKGSSKFNLLKAIGTFFVILKIRFRK